MKKNGWKHTHRITFPSAVKILITMKLTLCLILLSFLGTVASETYSQSTKFSLEFNNAATKDVLAEVENKSDFYFLYSEKVIDVTRKVSINISEGNIESVLNKLFEGTNVNYIIKDRQIVLTSSDVNDFYGTLADQQKTITGKVSDSSGASLPGVTVVVKGTTQGTITDTDGNYTLTNVPGDAFLAFSFVGMKMQEIAVAGKSIINVTMTEETIGLEEVVAIGYGTMKKKDLTGSVASIKGEELTIYPVANATQALKGKIAGVTITSADGRPNASISVRIRGGNSITQSNEPLFIIDGTPGNINDVPTSQIESISVLKDASSTAIYGAQGANGVIIVTTKSPVGDKISVSYDGYYQINTPSKYLGALDPYDFVKINWEFATLFGYGDAMEMAYGLGSNYSDLNQEGISAYRNIAGRDIEKEVIGTTYSQNHNITVSGGNKKTKYSVTLDHLDDDGLKIQSWYKKTNILAKLQSELAKGLVLDLNAYVRNEYVFGSESQGEARGSKLTESMRFTPVTPLGDVSGENSQLALFEEYIRPAFDPIAVINDIYNKSNTQVFRGSSSLAWTITDGLTLTSVYDMSKTFGSNYSYKGPVAKNTVGVEGGDASIGRSYSTNYRWANTLFYNVKGIGENHRLDLLLGQEMRGRDGEGTSIRGTRYPISFDYKKTFALMSQYGDQNEISISNSYSEPSRLASFFGRANYVFKNRYYLTTTLRADGASNFAPAYQWGYFPAAAVAWRISEEPFMQDASAVDNLKLRFSYGAAGNNQISSGLWKTEWTAAADGYAYYNIGNPYYVPATSMMTNPNLKWETTITRDLGVDFAFFRNRLFGNVDAYWNTTKDLLMVNSLPGYTGYTTQMDNVGQIRNRGIELSVTGDIVRKKDFALSANFNISFNKNKIEALSDEIDFVHYRSLWGSTGTKPSAGDYTFRVGDPIGLIRGYVYDGFYTPDDFDYDTSTQTYTLKDGIANSFTTLGTFPGLTQGAYPGMLKLKKMGTETSETEINETDDVTVIGDTNPKHTGGLNLNASYKSFDLMLGFNWSYGNDIYNANKLVNSYGMKHPFRNFSKSVEGWYSIFNIDNSGNLVREYTPEELNMLNSNATGPMPFHESAIVHSGGIEDGSYLRLNNVTLGYTLPSFMTQKIMIQRLRIYATLNNAWIWTKYTGYDPEVDAGKNRNSTYPTPSLDFGAYPRARTLTFGVNVNF
tara:strand:+ start:16609 stop:20208 length:3600 start_codon:yes stop_codon:yes gene_type:complete